MAKIVIESVFAERKQIYWNHTEKMKYCGFQNIQRVSSDDVREKNMLTNFDDGTV